MIKHSQPRISQLNSWDRHVGRVIEVAIEALSLFHSAEGADKLKEELSVVGDSREMEDKLNTVLYFLLCKANRHLQKQNRGLGIFPSYESRNTPNPNDRSIDAIKRQQKRADFTWGYADFSATDTCKGNRDFVIECKRLGSPPSKSTVLNKKYAIEGIQRFITDSHRYGEDESSGAMVGYIENMEFGDILTEVNTEITAKLKIEQIVKHSEAWQEKSTTHLGHSFDRPFEKSPFTLHHLWIDLKDCYPRKITVMKISKKG